MDICERQFITKLNALLVLLLRCVLFLNVYECFTCMHLWVCFPQRPENIRTPEIRVTEGCGHNGAVEKELRGSEECPVLSTAEPSF